MSVLARFWAANVDPLLHAIQSRSGLTVPPLSARSVEHYNQQMGLWPELLMSLSQKALQLEIDKLLLNAAPLAKVDDSHPLHNFLGGPPQDVATDLDKATDWYSKASEILTKRSDYLESDDANITAIRAKGKSARVRRVLGIEPPKYLEHSPLHPDPALRRGALC